MNNDKQNSLQTFLNCLSEILDPADLQTHAESAHASDNTLALKKQVLGIAYPRRIEQIQQVLRIAKSCRVPIYTVSQGKNIGYGDMTPTSENQFILNLKNMNAIREFDAVSGEVVIEPGVTQAQLASFLLSKKARFWMDVTGASPEASVIGNTLEAGFGHTPIGDHRKHILGLEAILANGEILQTGEMPSVGPDLAPLFVQSNLGIVTAMRIPLFAIPERTQSFTLSFATDEDFFQGLAKLQELRTKGVITNLIHTANATRTLMTSGRFPDTVSPAEVLTEQDCRQILEKRSGMKIGSWTAIGGIYGFADEMKGKRKRIQKAFAGIAKVQFFSDGKIRTLDLILNSNIVRKIKKLDAIRKSFASLKALHGILQGQPSSAPSENIFWRVHDPKNLGLAWHAPVLPATKDAVEALLGVARRIYSDYGFEMPLTLTLVNSKKLTAVFNINFDKQNARDVRRAHEAYDMLTRATASLGFAPYRIGLLSPKENLYDQSKKNLLNTLKMAMDPFHILAPGRYGIGEGLVRSPAWPAGLEQERVTKPEKTEA